MRLLPCAGALALAVLPGCLTLRRERFESFEPPPAGTIETLEQTAVDFDACLEALGAPLLVLEDPDGIAVAWGWQRQSNWFFTLSVPLLEGLNTSLSYNSFVLRLPGVMGFFDTDRRLIELRRGQLNELFDERRLRPQFVEARPAGGHE